MTSVVELLDEVDTLLDWERDPLRYFWCTLCACSAMMWFGFAGDNLQYYRMNGALAYGGGATNRMMWATSFGRTASGGVLLAYRACAFAACAYYEWSEKIIPRVAMNKETDMYGLDMSYFLNIHDWTIHAVTLFFALATLSSLRGAVSKSATQDHYIGHQGRCNTLEHWVLALYVTAFTMSVTFFITVVFEAIVDPQCVPSSSRGRLETLINPAARLCYLGPEYMLGYLGNVVLLLFEASLGRLPYPKALLSQPIFVLSFFFIASQFNVFVLNGDWPYKWTNYMRKETILYLNFFLWLAMLVHLGLVKFLKSASNQAAMKNLEERVPLFM